VAFNRDAVAPHRARTDCNELTELGIKLPKPVADALAVLDGIGQPTPPAPGALVNAVLDGASQDDLDRLALAELAAPLVRDAYGRASIAAADDVTAAIRTSRNEIHTALAKLATAAIDKLTTAATIDEPLEALVRAGRHTDAETVVAADLTAATLDRLYRTRERLLWPRGRYPVAAVTRWREPEYAGHGFLEGIRAGGTLWFPDFESACELAEQIQAEQRSAEQAVLASQKERVPADV
jgi:hypothetical protein